MIIKHKTIPVLVLILSGLVAAAGASLQSDRDALAERLNAMEHYAATFTQTVYGARGEVLEASTGHVLLRRPDFKWVVEDPYPQTIVAAGDSLQLYDPDLEQLTIRPLEEALNDTPVSLLTRDAVMIGERFRILQIADSDGASFVVEPASEETLYREILLHFTDVGLSGLDILDHLGQRTEIRFAPAPDTDALEDGDFTLTVPPGTDVIRG